MKTILCAFLIFIPFFQCVAELPPPVLYSENPYFSEIQGITLSSYPPNEQQLAMKNTGIHFVDLDIPGEPSELQRKLEPFLNDPLSMEEIAEIKEVVINYYSKRGYPQTTVELIDDQLTDGLIWLVVTPQK